MFLAVRDLRAATGRFALVGAVIGLVAMLGVLLSGLATGLTDDGISGLRALPLTHLVMAEGSDGVFSKSTLTPDMVSSLRTEDGVEQSNIGVSFVNSRSSSGANVDLALFGVEADSFLVPREDGREALEQDATIVISADIADEGVEVGDTLTLLGNDVTLEVVGVTQAGSYGHVPLAYTSLDTWRASVYGSDARDRFSAVALEAGSDDEAESATADLDGVELLTKTEAYDGSPGYTAESATLSLIRGFLYVISALIVGAFFTVWTVQRTRDIGLMKALGATDGYVIRDAVGQLGAVIIVATIIGSLIGYAIGLSVPDEVPFSLQAGPVIAASLALVVAGLAGSIVTIRRIASVDPLIALGSDR